MKSREYVAVLLAAVGLIAVSAQGVDLTVGPGSTVHVPADITYGSVSVEAGGELIVDAGATLSTDIGPLLVGSTGGAGLTASMTVNGHLNIQGSTTNTGEVETHSIDIGGQSAANFTLAAGSSITASGTIAFGMDAGWTGDPNWIPPYSDSGYRTDVTLGNGSSIVAGSFTMGAGDAMMGRPDTVVNVNGDVTFNASAYIVGGTLNINGGTLDLVDKRWTIRSAVGAVDGSSPDSDYTVFNFTGAAPLFKTTEKLNWGRLGGNQFGIVIDISDSSIPHNVWYTLCLGREGGTAGEAELARLSTDSEGILRVIQGSAGVRSSIDVFIPEPATMVVLALGAVALIRKKRR